MRKLFAALWATLIFSFAAVGSAADSGAGQSVSPDDPTGFVELAEAVPDVILEVRYYSTYNFVGDRIDGYEAPCVLMTREAAAALKAVSDDVMAQGYRLKVYDAYRPQMAVSHFVRWAEDLEDTRMKPYFYPNETKDVLFEKGYIAAKSGHSRGSTIDLTLFDMATGKEVDMGGTFDYFGLESHPDWCGNPDTRKYTGRAEGGIRGDHVDRVGPDRGDGDLRCDPHRSRTVQFRIAVLP